jgi:hypothetical protein
MEGYFWGLVKDQVSAGDDNDKAFVIGLRADYDVNDQFSMYGEYAFQFGDWRVSGTDHDHLEAMGSQIGAEYRFNDKYNSKVGLEYTYLSGDDRDSAEDYEAWRPFFENQNIGEIAQEFTNSNVHAIKVSGAIMPREDITFGVNYYYLQLAEEWATGTTLTPGGKFQTTTYTLKDNEESIGNEVDLSLIYDYTEDVQMGLVVGMFMPGDMFDGTNDDTAYSVRGMTSIEF